MTDADLIDALTRNVAGKAAELCEWRDLLRVRTAVAGLLDREINRRQNTGTDSTERTTQ